MSFSRKVRKDALVASARHCCICHRFKGVNVEVHHIIHTAQGGTNDPENAIVLCFDCHADVGHYNPDHPKGSRYSPSELRKARDAWHESVIKNEIPQAEEQDLLYCRYYLCKSYNAVNEILSGNMKNMPVESPLFLQNMISEYLLEIGLGRTDAIWRDVIHGECYGTKEAYSQVHPDVQLKPRSTINYYPYFEAIRVPNYEELSSIIAAADPISSLLLDANVPPDQISTALAYDEVCGDAGFCEIYRLRPLWVVFFAATNLSGKPLKMEEIELENELVDGTAYRAYSTDTPKQHIARTLPGVALPPGGTIICPIAIIVAPIEPGDGLTISAETTSVETGQVQIVTHSDMDDLTEQIHMIGPALWPSRINILYKGQRRYQSIHEFNISNLYTIDRYWEMGSCPHVFFRINDESHLVYYGELFARAPSVTSVCQITAPRFARELIIAELEPEKTNIDFIKINSALIAKDIHLLQGETFSIIVSEGDSIELQGFYMNLCPVRPSFHSAWLRNKCIYDFMCITKD